MGDMGAPGQDGFPGRSGLPGQPGVKGMYFLSNWEFIFCDFYKLSLVKIIFHYVISSCFISHNSIEFYIEDRDKCLAYCLLE